MTIMKIRESNKYRWGVAKRVITTNQIFLIGWLTECRLRPSHVLKIRLTWSEEINWIRITLKLRSALLDATKRKPPENVEVKAKSMIWSTSFKSSSFSLIQTSTSATFTTQLRLTSTWDSPKVWSLISKEDMTSTFRIPQQLCTMTTSWLKIRHI